jgi:ribosomal protein S10
MPFVTQLTLKSGDGDRLDAVVSDIKERAERKGVQLKGPHPKPPSKHGVSLHKGLPGEGTFDTWDYTVYTRLIEIVGYDEFARSVAEHDYPDQIHISADIQQFDQVGES